MRVAIQAELNLNFTRQRAEYKAGILRQTAADKLQLFTGIKKTVEGFRFLRQKIIQRGDKCFHFRNELNQTFRNQRYTKVHAAISTGSDNFSDVFHQIFKRHLSGSNFFRNNRNVRLGLQRAFQRDMTGAASHQFDEVPIFLGRVGITPDIADKFAVYTAGSIKTKGSFNAIILQVAVNCLRTADDVNANAVLLVVFSQQTGVGIGVVTADDYQRLDSKFFTVLLGRLEMFFGFQFSTSGTDHIKTTGIAVGVNDLIRQKDLFTFNQTVRPLEEAVKFARRIQRFQPVIKPSNYVVTARSLTTGKNHPDCQRRQRSTLTGLEG